MANYQVNLGVSANVSQAQQSIQNLQNTLNSIANTKITVDGGSIDTAAQSARLLSEHLAKATNATTGKIDFTALSNSLKAANTDLATLSNNLLAMGPKGQQAFSQVANAVAHAELSTRKANKALQNFGVTLMNTIKWQAASSMIHGVMGAFNSAVSHIEKLDKSLNSIQIVTGKTAGEMAVFAKQAQEASRALSSTTQEYADAALIYFQQGLGEKAIAERTEATLKMAKVTGDAVATVSDQLTAIWNNFDDGSKSLEHYVDVITALGAATASSTDEIADGLQKFAAIAETVGLSYEYAATALATVTSETRQSADVVGTAFKTLFARIQGLNLGETLDDGTTLNKYSEALAKVGIDIKLSNGELKDMNDILDEMGDKWERLNEDQQVALAQTVGGVRQYNQLIALMDNWDTFKINLDIAENSKGELDKQFEIYQSSVEASAAELKNATQSLYENLLSPEMITGFNEALADTIGLINTIVENAGGIGKLFEFGGLLLLQMVLPKLQGFLMSAATHMKDFIGYTKAAKMYELDTMAKTSHAIAGTSQRSNTRLSSSYEEGSGKFNRFERREDRRMARYDKWEAKANTAQETLEQGPQKGLQHGINVIRANVADAKAQAYSSTGATFMPNAQGVSGVDMDASAMAMRNQMIQEEAGYTATILDTKKQILALENGLTDKQREGYKAYSDQVAKEQEALRLAREKQAVTKDAAEQSSRSGTMKVGSSKAGRDAKAAMKQGEIDQLEEERKKKISSLTGDKESISRQTSEIDKEYNKKKEEVQNRHISNKQIDLKGDETKSMVEGFKDSDMSDTGQAITQSMTGSLTQSADGSGPAASVENLEKLGQLQAQYNADAAKASGIYTELSGNIGEAGKRTEQQQKALKKTGDTMKTLGKDAKSGLVDSLKESAKQMEKTGDSAEGLKKVIKSLEDGSDIDLGELNPKEIDAVKKSVGDLDEGLTEASTSAGELVGAMAEDMASATGQDAKIFTGIAEDAQVAKASALDADGATKQLQDTLNTKPPIMPDPFGTVLQGAQQATAAFTSFAMGAQMLSTGITTAFDENASAVERLMGVMMILQGVMSTVNAIQTAANVVDTIAVAVKAAKAAAAAKEAQVEGKGTVVTTANTVATSANAVAKLFAAMASKGLAGIIAGVLGAALIVSTIAIVANTVATQQETEAKQEATAAAEEDAAARKENADAIREETKELNKSADEYRKLYAVYEETKEAKSDLMEASYDLASSLGVENASLLVLSGSYEELNKEIEKHLKLKNQEAMAAAKGATKAAGVSYATGTGQSEGYWSDKGTDGDYSMGFWAGEKNVQWITDFLNSEAGKKYKDAGIGFYSGKLMADYTDESQIPYLMEMFTEMMESDEFREKGKNAGYDVSKGTLFQSWNRMKEEQGDRYTGLAEVVEAQNEQARITGVTESGLHEAETLDEFTAAYERYKDFVIESAGPFANATEIIADANEYLRTHSSYGELYKQMDAFKSLPDEVQDYAEDNGWTKDSTKLNILLSTYFDDNMTEDEIKRTLELSQQIADNNDIMAKVKFIPEMAGQLTDEMTYDDWAAWFEKFEAEEGDFETATGMSKKDFMGMGAESAKEFLNTLIPSQESQEAAIDSDIADLQEQRDILAGTEAQDTTTLSGSDLAIAQKWTEYRQGVGANATADELKAFLNSMATEINNQYGTNYADGMDLFTYMGGDLLNKQGYRFGNELTMDGFLAEQTRHSQEDAEAATQRQAELDSKDNQIKQKQTEKDYLQATEFKREVLENDLDIKEVEDLAESFKITAQNSEIFSENLANNEEAAKEAAKQLSRYNRAVETAADNMDDWKAALKGTDVVKQSKAIKELSETYADMFDLDATDFSDEFLRSTDNLELMEKALDGSEEAYNDLQTKVAMGIIEKHFKELPGITQEMIDEITSQKIKAGDLIEFDSQADGIGSQLFNMYSQAVEAAQLGGASVADAMAQANALMQAVGFEPPEVEMEEKEITLTGDIPDGWTPQEDGSVTTTDASGKTVTVQGVRAVKTEGGTYEYKQTILVPKGGGKIAKSTENLGGGKTSDSGGGGGGGKPKKADKVKKSDVVERYKEINDQLEETAHLLTKNNAEAEGLWGEARFKKMREGVELLKKENQQLKERMKWSKDYVDEDRTSLNAAAAEAGISFQYDENGYITNYTEQMTWLYNQLDNAINSANADGNVTEEEQEEIDKWQKYVDDIESARGDYEDALAQWREDEEKWLENRNKIWQDNFDILSEELELKVQLNTQDLEVLQYFLDKIEDAVYGIAEAFASGKYFEQQFANYSANLGLLSNETNDPKTQGFYQNLQDQYRNGDIGLSQYKQGLADMMGMTIENLENLQDLKESMQDFYGDVMEKALEEIAIYTDSMENLNSVLDHYSNILELVGKQDDYASKNKVLSSKAKNLRNEIDVQKRLYEESAADAAYWAQKMNEAEVGSNEYETYKKNWQAAEAAAQESQDAMLSKTQEWAEAMKAIIENELADFADQLEKSLTGGVSFDELMTSMERRSSLQEEYLTTTNKIYETNKLMRTAQQEIDKTSNTAAKRRMAQFISETQQLQNKNKLSQYELDIQQAKYDLLLAEIALEEAQDAKSVVRLQRDAEGNFGYVYTADQNAVADAEQQLADAQNSLYNIGLEGANNYQQKYAETLQESQEAITELTQMWMNGEISSEEEFNRRKQEIVEYYGEKLEQYSDLHSIALTTDSRVVKDAWSSHFTSMTASVDVWKQNVDTYFSQAGESMKDWADVCGQVLEDSGLDDMDKTLGDIDQKSKDLKNTLIGEDGKSGVVAAMMAEVDAAGQLSEEYIAIQDAIDGVIAEYEELLKILNEDYQSPTGPGDEDGKQNGEEEEEEEEETPDDSTPPPAAAQLSVGSTVKVKTSASKWVSGEGIWGPVKGNNFKVMQISGEKVLIGDPCGPNYSASGVTGWIKKTDLEGFDTGGYTGDWSGAYGKLALLHKKELILKEGDTANFLAGMDLLNKIISVIDLQSVNNSLGGLLSSPSLGHVGDEGGILEQQVHIEASFPGVSDHSEIEEAFNNLVNQAAQYANRK